MDRRSGLLSGVSEEGKIKDTMGKTYKTRDYRKTGTSNIHIHSLWKVERA